MYFRNYSLRRTWILECIAGLVPEHLSAVNVIAGPTHCRTLQKGTAILRCYHSHIDRAGKETFYSDLKS